MKTLKLAFSPCPNDTFIFHALAAGLVSLPDVKLKLRIAGIDTLNSEAFDGLNDITKLSFPALFKLEKKYAMLNAGAALGRGCGPLVVTGPRGFRAGTIAVPGAHTTAALLLSLWMREPFKAVNVPYDQIMPGIRDGLYSAGVIIHEGRFVYERYGLSCEADLGEWWESLTGLPIPLGCIAARRSMGAAAAELAEVAVRDSVEYALSNPEASAGFVHEHASEMEKAVVEAHIALYVNGYTVGIGDEGKRAVEVLRGMANERGLL